MKHSPKLAQLIDALRALPGVGPKTAQRMAFHLLQEGRAGGRLLATALQESLECVARCRRCRMLTEGALCSICASSQRDETLLCVVESPAGARELEALLQEGKVRELIVATNPTVEGEATAHFLGELAARRGVRASRIAHGVPMGGELEYVDGGTLAHALAGRQAYG
jgi:recombination protein RecR